MLQLKGVSKRFGATQALHATDLDVPAERTTVLIGQSGCGKSTLLRLMIGLISPERGTVRFRDAELTPASVMEIRRHMGYVIQEGGLFPHLTARDNVTLMARYLRIPAQRRTERVDELARLTHFPVDGLERYPAQLSGGQQQRVSLMRALMLDPDVLLLDEPLGALDPMIRRDLQEELREIFRALDKTVVMVTHDLAEAAFFADEIVLMRMGRIVQRGAMRALLDSPADPYVSEFVNAQRRPLAQLEGGADAS